MKKWLEYLRNLIRGDSNTGVAYPDPDQISASFSANPNVALRCGELDCVRDEVEQDLPKLFPVCPDRQPAVARVTREGKLLFLQIGLDCGFECLHHLLNAYRPNVDGESSGLDSGEAEHILDEGQQMLLVDSNPHQR